MADADSIARKVALLWPHLDERQRRLVLGAEARELGRGGITLVARATGISTDTVAKGVRELEAPGEPSGGCAGPVAGASG